MSLIKSLLEIQEVLPKLVSSVSDFSLTPNWERVEYKYIVPIIGTALYSALVTSYENDTLDSDETDLLKKIRLVIAAYGYKDELGLYTLTLGDSGAKKITQGGAEPIRGWEMTRLENTLITAAMDGIEILLNYLFNNKDIFPEWTESPQFAKIKSLLIVSGSDFNENYTLFQPQRSFFVMRTVIYDVQRLFLEETIGRDLLLYLINLDVQTNSETECIALLKKALSFYSISKACRHFSVSFTDNGFTILGEKNNNSLENQLNQPVDLQLLEMKIKECEKEGGSYLELGRYKLVAVYKSGSATNNFKTAFEAGPLKNYIDPDDRTSGNECRNIYVMP